MDNQLATIRNFVGSRISGVEFTDDDDLFASGHVNSLFAVQIVMFVERTFGVAAAGDDLDIRNFASIARIDGFVAGKLAGADLATKA